METVVFLEKAGEGMKAVAALGRVQTEARAGVLDTINELCDALQLASDLISKEISTTIVEFYEIRGGSDERRDEFLAATVARFADGALATLLHEGKVCGRLHVLGDRFSNPLSNEAWSGIPFWEAIGSFFTRSSSMSKVLDGLLDGEKHYLSDMRVFLQEVQQTAEGALASPSSDACENLMTLLRKKRRMIQSQARDLRDVGDQCIATLA
jgi:hypothetical protein